MKKISIHAGKTDLSPEAARYNPRAIRDLDNLFIDLIKRDKLQAASYLLAREGKIFAHKAMGRLLYNDPVKEFQVDSIRWIASITKVFTTVSIMQLIEDGLLYLEQPVADIIREFDTTMHNRISLFHLMTHTSGLPADGGYFLEPHPYWKEIHNMDELIRFFLEGPVRSAPGAAWSYSSCGFVILGEVVKRVSGMSYEEYVQKKILKPLGMQDTYFDVPVECRDRVCLVNEDEEKHHTSPVDEDNLFSAGGGLASTPYDLFRFGQMILNQGTLGNVRILGRKTVEAMTRNRLGGNTPAYAWGRGFKHWEYGIGLDISQGNLVSYGTLNHEGYGRSGLYIDPSEEFIAMYMVPTPADWDAETMENPRSVIWSGIL